MRNRVRYPRETTPIRPEYLYDPDPRREISRWLPTGSYQVEKRKDR
jgi:hypothetical protein